MTTHQTAVYPPGPAPRPRATPDTNAETLFSPPVAGPVAGPVAPQSAQATLMANAPSTDHTLVVAGGPNAQTLEPPSGRATLGTSGRGSITVLPEVRSEGEQLIMVPRDKTRYESDKLLGRGGMGEVKLAHDHDIGRKVAVKRLLDERNPYAVARFIDEVRTVGSLEHPNIVPIHDVGVDEQGALFFVMKYVEGETLAAIIEKLAAGDRDYHARYNIEARLEVFIALLRALQYAHSQGLVHRDIKPENLMIGRYGEVVLMDWGIAHAIRGQERPASTQAAGPFGQGRASTETVDGAVVGTPQYMSPEQALGEVAELDGRSDLYSAFMVLWELLTLQPYVKAGNSAMETVIAAAARQAPRADDPVYQQIPHQDMLAIELRGFLFKGLQPKKDARFASAEAAVSELARVRAGDFQVVCPVTFMKHSNRKLARVIDRSPVTLMMAGLVGTLGFLGGLAGWAAWLLG